jgi:phosphoglycerate kinase
MKKLTELDLKNKTVLLRCDFNVPLSLNGEVLDDFRIRQAVPTIKYLAGQNAKVILMSHLETKYKKHSLNLIVSKLNELLNQKVEFITDYLEESGREKIKKLNFGQIALLENLRFHKGEKENDKEFAKKISRLGELFINEAFSVSHREHASIVSIPKYLPSAIGFLFEKELKILSKLLENPKRPFVVIIGGIKIKTKIKTILNLLKKSDHLLLGSKIGEAILAQKGILKQRKFEEEESVSQIDLTNLKIHLPLDGIIALKGVKGSSKDRAIGTVKKDEDIYDIGPETIEIFKKIIKQAKTILLNGPLGMYEDKRFQKGTKEILEAIVSNKSAFKVAGGGETLMVINKFQLKEGFDFLSTGGGAMLEFLAGEKLVGVEAIR